MTALIRGLLVAIGVQLLWLAALWLGLDPAQLALETVPGLVVALVAWWRFRTSTPVLDLEAARERRRLRLLEARARWTQDELVAMRQQQDRIEQGLEMLAGAAWPLIEAARRREREERTG